MVPEGWTLSSLGELTRYKKGFAFDSKDYQDSGVRIIRISDTNRDAIHSKNPVFVSSAVAENVSDHTLRRGDIILSTVGSRPHLRDSMVGKAVRVTKEADGSLLNQNLVKLTGSADLVDQNLLYLWLKDERFISFITTLVRGNANQVSITLKDIFNYKISLPPLAEQRKIAEILSTWDRAIEVAEAQLKAARTIKRALMQRLLTGKRRFPEFEGEEWKEVRLGDVAKLGRGRVISKGEIEQNVGHYPVYSSQTANNGEFGAINTYDFDGEYVTWTTDGVHAGTVYYRSGKFNCTNVCGTILVNPQDGQTRFIAYALEMVAKRYVSHTLANPKLMNGVMATVTFAMPSLEEQRRISAVLGECDKEITACYGNITKLCAEKKALMQQLLAGKRRVLV